MIFGNFLNATRSVASCFLRHRRERPGTLLRTLCVAAFDFTARSDGRPLTPAKRRALSCLLDLGAAINDHFDQHRLCKCGYRKLRRRLSADETARAAYRVYFRALRVAERNRPRLPGSTRDDVLKESAEYRERVVRISLSALAAVALGQPDSCDTVDRPISPAGDACLPRLFALVMLIQICDDLLDWRKDWRAGLPTFVTSALLQCEGQADGGDFARARAIVATAAAAYLAAAPKLRCALWPFVPCTYAAFLLVKLLGAVALRGPASREATDNAGIGSLQVSPRW